MGGSLFLDLELYGDKESRAIAALAAQNDDLGAAWAFIRNRRTLAEYREYLKADRALKRILRQERWSSPY